MSPQLPITIKPMNPQMTDTHRMFLVTVKRFDEASQKYVQSFRDMIEQRKKQDNVRRFI